MSKHEENWVGFPAEIDDHFTLVKADVGWVEEGPDDRLGSFMRVRVACPPVGFENLGDFLEELDELEGALTLALETKLGAAFVGTLLNEEYRDWCYYVKDAKKAKQAVEGIIPQFEKYAPDVVTETDAHWTHYAEIFFPDDDQQRYIADQSVIDQLAEHGDESNHPRPIEHLGIFPTPQARDNFVKWCEENGYSVTEASEFNDEYEGYLVEFNHVGPAITEDIWERTIEATNAAEACGGDYDGWQTCVIRDGKPVEPTDEEGEEE